MNQVSIFSRIIIFFVMAFLGLSCEPDEPESSSEGTVEFAISAGTSQNEDGARILQSQTKEKAAYVAVTITDLGGAIIFSNKIELLNFNGNYISEPIPLGVGNYKLTEFLVLNHAKEVIYATPKEGSPLDHLVKMPLSIPFDVKKDEMTQLEPGVASTKKRMPEDFGYATFDFKVISTFDFLIKVFIKNDKTGKLEPAEATLQVLYKKLLIYTTDLTASTNKITLSNEYGKYTFVVDKNGYMPYQKTFKTSELKQYFKESGKGPLVVILKKNHLVLWNKLGSDEEVLNSEVGPNLEFYKENDGLNIPANREYVEGKFGKAITIAPGNYSVTQRVHNLVLNDLPNVIDPERGTIECYFYQNESPRAYVHNPHRIFDGGFGLDSGLGFMSHDFNDQGIYNVLTFYLTLGGETVTISSMDFDALNGQWVYIAAVWDREGIDNSQETMQLYINGVKKANTTQKGWGTQVGQRADIAGGNDHNIARKFYMDNLKIYDFAKTDFSDRLQE